VTCVDERVVGVFRVISTAPPCRRGMKDGSLQSRRRAMLAPVMRQVVPMIVRATQFADDFATLEKDKQEHFRKTFRCGVHFHRHRARVHNSCARIYAGQRNVVRALL
jgi:hypothetical protein